MLNSLLTNLSNKEKTYVEANGGRACFFYYTINGDFFATIKNILPDNKTYGIDNIEKMLRNDTIQEREFVKENKEQILEILEILKK